jgi:hypothetical protein
VDESVIFSDQGYSVTVGFFLKARIPTFFLKKRKTSGNGVRGAEGSRAGLKPRINSLLPKWK